MMDDVWRQAMMIEMNIEVSGLMIMGLFGGTVFPLLMGLLSDTMASQTGASIILTAGVIYLIFLTFRLKEG